MIIMINSKFRTLKANVSNNLIPITSDIHYNRRINEKNMSGGFYYELYFRF